MYNLGIPGDTSEGVLERFERELLVRDYEVIICAIGINDSRCIEAEDTNQTPIEQFAENIQELIHLGKKYASKVIFIGLTPIWDGCVNETREDGKRYFYSNIVIQKFDTILRESCEQYCIPVIEVMDCIQSEHLSDGLHPNQA